MYAIGKYIMDDQQLKRSLQSIGMACFVKYYEMFADPSVSNDTAVDILMKEEKFSESGSRTRVNQSRRIIREGRRDDALEYISQSSRIDSEWSGKAKSLLAVNK